MTEAEIVAFRAGFRSGFAVSREGFNGECQYDHCAPSDFLSDDPLTTAEDAQLAEYQATGRTLSFDPIGRREPGPV